jgi:hypothetical protein
MITCVLTPTYVAFPDFYTPKTMILDNIMNAFFVLDILVNFFTAYYDEDFLLIEKNKVYLNSVKGFRILLFPI